jgi:hypothetical protein
MFIQWAKACSFIQIFFSLLTLKKLMILSSSVTDGTAYELEHWGWSPVRETTKMSMFVFWVVTLCGLVGRYQCFGGRYYLHLQSWSPHGVTTRRPASTSSPPWEHYGEDRSTLTWNWSQVNTRPNKRKWIIICITHPHLQLGYTKVHLGSLPT